jgi:Reverse transcriptase (RNA-dependent DNA polymerase).
MITNEKHLLYILGVNKIILANLLANIDDYYYSFDIEKTDKFTGKAKLSSDGEVAKRQINSSKGKLKEVQKRLYKFMITKVNIPEYVYGGIKGKNNVRNARFHQGNKYIFTTDLKSFFPSISNKQVFNMFIREGCTPTIARTLTKLTTRNNEVPQGIPTSTLIANLVFKPIGEKIAKLTKENDIKFSMFVDDITLSSKTDFKYLIPTFLSIIKQAGFKISYNKTHYQTKNPIITGVICQNNRLLAPLGYKKKLAILKKELTKDESIKNKVKGVENYLSVIKNSNKHS